MRLYLEAVEEVSEEVSTAPEFIRLDVTDKDWRSELQTLKSLLNPDKHYTIRLHYCRHDEGGLCYVELVEGA